MIQETRKDPRAKVLSMTVRYKSATIDEFIEHHSHDVSRGGMFIKTPSPFPPGTLLKFEVRISEEKKVMQGVGRVVWKRDASAASPDTPAGMGVKFIKLDDESKAVIDRLVGTRGNKDGAYDVGERSSQPAAEPTAQAIKVPRKGTMIGLGAVTPDLTTRSSTPAPASEESQEKPSEGFFPSGGPTDQPPPEDRTVMRQAAELLRDALIEAGGSMEEIGPAGNAPVVAAPNEASDAQKHVSDAPAAANAEAPKTTEKVESAAVAKEAQSARPTTAEKPAATPTTRTSRPPGQRPLSSWEPAPAQKSGRPALMLLGVAAIGGGLFWLTHQSKPAEPETPKAEPAPVVAQPAPEPIASAEPTPAASAEPQASAAPPVSAAPSASAAPPADETPAQKAARLKAEAAAKKAEEDAKKAEEAAAKKAAEAAKKAEEAAARKAAEDAKKAELEAKKAAAAAAAAAAPKPPPPKPKAPAPKPPAAAAPPSEAPPPAEPPAEKPAEAVKPSAPVEPAPAPAPKEPPAPTPKAPESDNPY